MDDFLKAYADARELQSDRAGTHLGIGYLYLTISLDVNFCEFSFEACASDTSRLLVASPAVRKVFNKLLKDHKGLFGLIDTEGPGYPSLWLINPAESLPLNSLGNTGSGNFGIDDFVAHVREIADTVLSAEEAMASSVYNDVISHIESYWGVKGSN